MKSLFRIFHPEVFQGSLKSKNYFEGWYFKHVSGSGENAFAVIPGISLSADSHSFIQFIDGISGHTAYFRYDIDDFSYNREKLGIRIGKSFFTTQGIELNLEDHETAISGKLEYSEMTMLPKSILMPGIMGWYSYVPGMECNHGVVSVDHKISGSLTVNNITTVFDNGRGYIEKDWGISFPESWIWLQCNNFSMANASIMISIAKVPWKGSYFIGLISFVSLNGQTRILATYNGARVHSLKKADNKTEIIINKGKYQLSATIIGKGTGFLKAPLKGQMNEIIKESIDSEVYIEFKKGSELVFSGKGIRAGFEETEKIFTYF